jgi:RNase P subunit RPR2
VSEKIASRRLDRIVRWLEERTNATCPFCGAREWTVDDELGCLPAVQSAEPRVQTDRGHTLVLVTCTRCGFSAPFAEKAIPDE